MNHVNEMKTVNLFLLSKFSLNQSKWIFKNIHYAPLMMSQKESPRNHPWVIPKKVACLVWVPDSRLIVNDGWFLLLLLLLIRAEILLIGRRKWWVIPGWFLLLLPSGGGNTSKRNHPSLTINLESWTNTKLAPFLGTTHGWFLGDSFCDIINGA